MASKELCAFCQQAPAVVSVPLPSHKKKKKTIPTPFCLKHYYTTSASRIAGYTILDQEAIEQQMPQQQQLFAEAYVQLRQELQDAALQQFETHGEDPLAILGDLNKKPKRKRGEKVGRGGGFLRTVPVPERLIQTQKQQYDKQQELLARMNRASDVTQRRKPTRKSIWNVMLDDEEKEPPSSIEDASTRLYNDQVTCTCGSDQVDLLSSNTSQRNQDMAKAETWGNKDRGDTVVSRYQCQTCGKMWNEET